MLKKTIITPSTPARPRRAETRPFPYKAAAANTADVPLSHPPNPEPAKTGSYPLVR